MDEVMTRAQRLVCVLACALSASGALVVPAGAQGLPDPTRPPATMYNASSASAAPLAPQLPQLQSVLVSQGRRVAVIDGETYRAGDTYKGKRVAAVGEDEVVLVQGKQRQVVKLYPIAAGPSR